MNNIDNCWSNMFQLKFVVDNFLLGYKNLLPGNEYKTAVKINYILQLNKFKL